VLFGPLPARLHLGADRGKVPACEPGQGRGLAFDAVPGIGGNPRRPRSWPCRCRDGAGYIGPGSWRGQPSPEHQVLGEVRRIVAHVQAGDEDVAAADRGAPHSRRTWRLGRAGQLVVGDRVCRAANNAAARKHMTDGKLKAREVAQDARHQRAVAMAQSALGFAPRGGERRPVRRARARSGAGDTPIPRSHFQTRSVPMAAGRAPGQCCRGRRRTSRLGHGNLHAPAWIHISSRSRDPPKESLI
jgi:hypothetical protein